MKINGKRIIGLEKQIFKVFAISQENAFVEKNMLLELHISIPSFREDEIWAKIYFKIP